MVSVKDVADRIESVLPKRRPINHHEPFIDKKKASIEIAQCLASGIQNYAPVDLFEDWLKTVTGSEYVLATNTGTSALHLALLAVGIKPHDEVIVPTTTFVATAHAVTYIGAIPHFIDGAPNIDPDHLKEYLQKNYKKKIKAIIVVHLFGIPADIKKICEVAKEFNLIVIEDACQALGSKINNKHVGTFGSVGVLSFNNNKIITCNGGGALVTNDFNIWHESRQYSIMGRIPHKYLIEHERIGWNYRMSPLNASLGLSQAREFKKIMDFKANLAQKYLKSLGNTVEFVEIDQKLVENSAEIVKNNWLNAILIDNRDELLEELNKRGIKARASFTPLHKLPFYDLSKTHYKYIDNVQEQSMPVAEEFFKRCVCLPSGAV